jgi:hypothetical protein
VLLLNLLLPHSFSILCVPLSAHLSLFFGSCKFQLPTLIAPKKVARDLSHLGTLAQQEYVSVLVRKSTAGLWDEAVGKGKTKVFPAPYMLLDVNKKKSDFSAAVARRDIYSRYCRYQKLALDNNDIPLLPEADQLA